MTRHVFESPEGKRWNGALHDKMAIRWRGPERAARLALTFASGRADDLAGRLVTVNDDISELLTRIHDIRADDLYTMRLVTSTTGHVPAVLLHALEESG
jgi:hypothetical protein